MKKTISVVLLLTLILTIITLSSCRKEGRQVNLFIEGSTSTERVMFALIEEFEVQNENVRIYFSTTGSGAGIRAAREGNADIGTSSRFLNADEYGVDYVTFAIDGLAVIIHPSNPITNLTTEQINAIFNREIVNWSELGGEDLKISVIGREAGSGSRRAFEDIVGIENPKHDQELTSGGAVATAVATNPNAIGYTSLSAINSDVNAVSVNGIVISRETLLNNSYSVFRPFIFLTRQGVAPNPTVQAFIDFALSEQATEIISSAGVLQAE